MAAVPPSFPGSLPPIQIYHPLQYPSSLRDLHIRRYRSQYGLDVIIRQYLHHSSQAKLHSICGYGWYLVLLESQFSQSHRISPGLDLLAEGSHPILNAILVPDILGPALEELWLCTVAVADPGWKDNSQARSMGDLWTDCTDSMLYAVAGKIAEAYPWHSECLREPEMLPRLGLP